MAEACQTAPPQVKRAEKVDVTAEVVTSTFSALFTWFIAAGNEPKKKSILARVVSAQSGLCKKLHRLNTPLTIAEQNSKRRSGKRNPFNNGCFTENGKDLVRILHIKGGRPMFWRTVTKALVSLFVNLVVDLVLAAIFA